MANHNDLGKAGEIIAADHLGLNGYEIIEKNWRFGKAEIDIIAKKETLLIFIEVKTRSTDFFGKPEEFVSQKKMEMVADAANVFIEKMAFDGEIRFDVIGIVLKKDNSFTLQHFEDTYFPEW